MNKTSLLLINGTKTLPFSFKKCEEQYQDGNMSTLAAIFKVLKFLCQQFNVQKPSFNNKN